ncbi:heterokaryon incompatibility protein-domain-containing protein [Alternaria rosae]|uniref:heterokaryon incompatibility protein-domain-containing protein n=1 Tax=Alternaria rosae TaxID=1187941 RepID=UPI001E8DB631|nr:heterokaryon incompatibility protein-domain-containing protein [Alternaria rosae]KAH6870605.1 heterokaryon incompatibility protein-domain-containing protein [Alternaria rosae]
MSKRRIKSPSPPPETKRPKVCDEGRNDTIYESIPAGEFIRVLRLQPGDTDQDIECSLQIVGIEDSKGSYEAISYVWGDTNDIVDIQCNGLRVAITVSLADALRTFRHSSEPRLLWADALCINQKDDKEKGHQVTRMGTVYANAKCTLVWLGCDYDDQAEDTFDLIYEANAFLKYQYLHKLSIAFEEGHFKYDIQGNSSVPDPIPTKPDPIDPYDERWQGVKKLLEYPWFLRVWTVQEAAISKVCRVFWSFFSIDISDVLELCAWLRGNDSFYDTVRDAVGEIQRLLINHINLYLNYNTHRPDSWQQSRTGLVHLARFFKERKFSMILDGARHMLASDARDHIYAFLGCSLAKDADGCTLVEADYTCSLHDLLVRVAYALMKNPAEGPWTLSSVLHGSRKSVTGTEFPSWVPVWLGAEIYSTKIANPGYWYRAGISERPFIAKKSGREYLTVKGCIFDTVLWKSHTIRLDQTGITPTYPYSAIYDTDALFIDTIGEDVARNAVELGISVSQSDVLRTLSRGYPDWNHADAVSDERQRRLVKEYRTSTRMTAEPTDSESYDLGHYYSQLRFTENATIFLTRDGRIGLAPAGDLVEINDMCCIFFGATVPFLLTPAKEGRHKLVGECYIQGVMDGELMQQFAGSDLRKHCIVLE